MLPKSEQQSAEHPAAIELNQEPRDAIHAQLQMLIQKLDSVQRSFTGSSEHQNGLQYHTYLHRMLVKAGGKWIVLQAADIDWIEAWGDYVRLHCKGKTHIAHQKISDMEMRLDPQQFLRIGRSAIININRIKELEPLNHGDFVISLLDDTQLNLSRKFRDRLSAIFDRHL